MIALARALVAGTSPLYEGQRLELLAQDVCRVGVQPVAEHIRIDGTEVDAEMRVAFRIELCEIGRPPWTPGFTFPPIMKTTLPVPWSVPSCLFSAAPLPIPKTSSADAIEVPLGHEVFAEQAQGLAQSWSKPACRLSWANACRSRRA